MAFFATIRQTRSFRYPIFICIIAANSICTAFAEDQPLAPTAFNEPDSLPERVGVNGQSPLVGMTFVDDLESNVRIHELTLRLPSGNWEMTCVHVRSSDGRYNAQLEYDLTGVTSREVTLSFPTKHSAWLATLRASELALLAELNCHSGSTGEPSRRLATIGWQRPREEPKTLLLLINPGQADDVKVTNLADASRDYRCTRLQNGTFVSYNTLCQLPMLPKTSSIRVKVQPYSFGKKLVPTVAEVVIP